MYDLVQRKQLKSTRQSVGLVADETQRQARRADVALENLEMRLESLITANEAMWQLLCETTGLTDAHLAHRFSELDRSDGREDGKKQVRANPCTCGAMVNARLTNCQFCGAPAPDRSFFDTI
mgnify:CR=1 FL=1